MRGRHSGRLWSRRQQQWLLSKIVASNRLCGHGQPIEPWAMEMKEMHIYHRMHRMPFSARRSLFLGSSGHEIRPSLCMEHNFEQMANLLHKEKNKYKEPVCSVYPSLQSNFQDALVNHRTHCYSDLLLLGGTWDFYQCQSIITTVSF